MKVTLQLPSQVEEAYLAEARARGLSLDVVVSEVLIAGQPDMAKTEVVSASVFEQGLGLFGSPEDAALLDEVVAIAYAERRRPGKSPVC